jgi:hypothetical protein
MTKIEDTIIQGLKIRENDKQSIMEHHQRLSSSGINVDEEGLIVPKKLHNPCLDSRNTRELYHEIRWNAKAGINVLDKKSELQKVMEKRNSKAKDKERQVAEQAEKTPFQKMLEERAKRLEEIESQQKGGNSGNSSEDSGHSSPEPKNEIQKVRASLKNKGSFSQKLNSS